MNAKIYRSNKDHWNSIYATKAPNQVSWTQEVPRTSLDFIYSFGLDMTASIIDVGGGDSKLAGFLLEQGYTDITVLDISEKALERAQARLGKNAERVKWIISDITEFQTDRVYDVWHDRATFHFLTSGELVGRYLEVARSAIRGFLMIGTFSESGPKQCSGLDIMQYNEAALQKYLENGFDKLRCVTEGHRTPFNTIQDFLFCSFKRNSKMF